MLIYCYHTSNQSQELPPPPPCITVNPQDTLILLNIKPSLGCRTADSHIFSSSCCCFVRVFHAPDYQIKFSASVHWRDAAAVTAPLSLGLSRYKKQYTCNRHNHHAGNASLGHMIPPTPKTTYSYFLCD